MTDDELDWHLRDICACRDADSLTGSNPPTARDRLRLAIDAAVRAERERAVQEEREAIATWIERQSAMITDMMQSTRHEAICRDLVTGIRARGTTPKGEEQS